MKIGLVSDTHGYLDPSLKKYFAECDEIWHAGDFGTAAVADELAALKPLRGVYGNIDGQDIRSRFPLESVFERNGCLIYMTHIGGTPPRYNRQVRQKILEMKPDLFVCGHSHILKVMMDKTNHTLYLNPGAAGRQGFHKLRTALRFEIKSRKPANLEVVQLGARSAAES